jgi:hypothetical protein
MTQMNTDKHTSGEEESWREEFNHLRKSKFIGGRFFFGRQVLLFNGFKQGDAAGGDDFLAANGADPFARLGLEADLVDV